MIDVTYSTIDGPRKGTSADFERDIKSMLDPEERAKRKREADKKERQEETFSDAGL